MEVRFWDGERYTNAHSVIAAISMPIICRYSPFILRQNVISIRIHVLDPSKAGDDCWMHDQSLSLVVHSLSV